MNFNSNFKNIINPKYYSFLITGACNYSTQIIMQSYNVMMAKKIIFIKKNLQNKSSKVIGILFIPNMDLSLILLSNTQWE